MKKKRKDEMDLLHLKQWMKEEPHKNMAKYNKKDRKQNKIRYVPGEDDNR